ncbi:MAG: phosphoribosyltransferase [Methanolinea sp.]|nr:phosphoribosyltransferase [Methanolinea sp.]
MLSESFSVELVSWREAVRLSRALAEMVRGRLLPDLVVAIGRGGFVPARILCDSLMITTLTSIRVEHWGQAAQCQEKALVRYPLSTDIRDLDVLVVDDVTDTGETLETACQYLESLSPRHIRTGVLHHKTCSKFTPDYYPLTVSEWRWIVYPWALHEDLTGFVERVMGPKPVTVADIRSLLQEKFSMAPSSWDVTMALEELVRQGRVTPDGATYRKRQD